MEKCKLCGVNEANDTGSHVVPHFLLKRIFNVDKAKGRNKEISFKLTAYDVESHFGSEVLPEKLEEVFGELTDEELEEKAMADLVVNNEWCTSCEKKFADLENEYAGTLKTHLDIPYQSSKNRVMPVLFWLSILWRASVTRKLNIRMSLKDEKKVRRILADYSPGTKEELTSAAQGYLDEISYKIYRSPDYSEKRGTFLYAPSHRQPYCMLIDEFSVMIYLKKKHLKENTQIFFGFEKTVGTSLSSNTKGEIVQPITEENFASYIDKFVDFLKDMRFRAYEHSLTRLFYKLGNKGNIPSHIKQEILQIITNDQTKLGRKYTYADFVKATTIVLMRHAH